MLRPDVEELANINGFKLTKEEKGKGYKDNETLEPFIKTANTLFHSQKYTEAQAKYRDLLKKKASPKQLGSFAFRLSECVLNHPSLSEGTKQKERGRYLLLAFQLDPTCVEYALALAKFQAKENAYESYFIMMQCKDSGLQHVELNEFRLSLFVQLKKWEDGLDLLKRLGAEWSDKYKATLEQVQQEETKEKAEVKKEHDEMKIKRAVAAASLPSLPPSLPYLNKNTSIDPLTGRTVPHFRIRVLHQDGPNHVVYRNMSKMAHSQNEEVAHWFTPRCHIEWKPKYESQEEIDAYVLINFPNKDDGILNGKPGISHKTVYIDMEPKGNRDWFSPPEWARVDRGLFGGYVPHNGVEWHLPQTYSELSKEIMPAKRKLISIIVSGEERLVGHRQRLALVEYLDKHWPDDKFPLDIFGKANPRKLKHYRGALPANEKHKAYENYYYTVSLENTFWPRTHADNYATEKFWDAVLKLCHDFYAGCSNLEQWGAEPGSFTRINIIDFKKSLDTIVSVLSKHGTSEDVYLKSLAAMQRTKTRILNELQFFGALEKIFLSNFVPITELPKVRAFACNLDRRPDRWAITQQKIRQMEELNHNKAKFEVERFSATDGKLLQWNDELEKLFRVDEPYKPKRFFTNHGYLCSLVGVAMSFYRFLQMVSELPIDDLDPVMWMEDDDIFQPNFFGKWRTIYQTLRSDPRWSVCYLGHTDMLENEVDEWVHPYIQWLKSPPKFRRFNGAGLFALLIRKRAAKQLLALMEKHRIQFAIDHFLVDHQDTVVTYIVRPSLIISLPYSEQNKDSDVQQQPETLVKSREEYLKRKAIAL